VASITPSGRTHFARNRLGILLAALVVAMPRPASAIDDVPPKVIRAVPTLTPPVIDGRLSDSCWQQAPPASDFVQFDPVEGAPPTERTFVRLLYDDDALYVGVLCADAKPALIVRQLSRRDRPTEADRFSLMIDSYDDRQTAFVFVANVSGVQGDGILSQSGSVYDNTWDAVWTVRTRIVPEGWIAEFAIPWNALRFAEGSYEWGINFRRYISRKKELVEWVMVPRSERFPIPLWGKVGGIRDITPPVHLDVAPYVSVAHTSTTGEFGQGVPSGTEVQAGVDVKYGLSRNFTLDATINPDFGQVEVDQAVLNLTVFETRFPEKRPFFLEAAQMFTFGSSASNLPLTLFFSRRIGRRPGGSDTVVPGPSGTVLENPQVTTILGAAKVTGRTIDGLSVAALSALTAEEHARIGYSGGDTTILTEPAAGYHVVRVKQEWEGGSWLGGMATLAARRGTSPVWSGGLDWNARVDNGRSTIDGYFAGTHAPAAAAAQDGMAGRLLFSRISAEHWFPTVSYDFFTPRFAPNDLGFFAQPHDHGGFAQLLYRENRAGGMFLRYSVAVNPELRWNWDNFLTTAVVRGEFAGEFRNFWRGEFIYARSFSAFDDEERGIIGLYRRPGAQQMTMRLLSDDRHAVYASLLGGMEWDDLQKRSLFAGADLTLRPTSWMELNPAAVYQNTRGEEAWVYPYGNIVDVTVSPDPFSVFGDRNVELLDLSLRGIVTFSRTLSVQFYTQVLYARGRYSGFRRLTSPEELLPYAYESFAGFINPDFNTITLNANVLLRWEYLPGSTLYLVWTQLRDGDTGIYGSEFGQRLGDVWSMPREDAVLLKAVYWLGL
jgi:hypothetical protein